MRIFQVVICFFWAGSFLRSAPVIGPFLEPELPFFGTALVIRDQPRPNRVRRGMVVSLGDGHWACFDTDLLRWAAIWKAPVGKPPVTDRKSVV